MSANEFEQFAAAFGCSLAMAEATVNRIRQRMGGEVPMPEMLAAIKRIAPSRLTTDTLVARLQKDAAIRSAKPVPSGTANDPDSADRPAKARSKSPKGGSAKSQISELLTRNWTRAKDQGLIPPNLPTDKFVRAARSAAGEPKPTVARMLEAVEKLSKRDVVITPNLVADEIIEANK
jgi:hypothetical protein